MAKYDVKKIIKDCYLKIYKDRSPDFIKVNVICNDAHISRSTFYKYFNSANDVLKEIEKDIDNQMAYIYNTENYQKITDIDINTPSPNYRSMFVCVANNSLFFQAALSNHGNPSYVKNSKSIIYSNLKNSLKGSIKSDIELNVICEFASQYILMCCKVFANNLETMTVNGLSILVKKIIVEMVQNHQIYFNGERNNENFIKQ